MISLELPIKKHTFAKRNQNLYQIEVLQSLKKRSEMRFIIFNQESLSKYRQ